MNLNDRFIKIAIEEALKTDYKFKVGAVIFDKDRLISKGRNYNQKSVKKLHPKFKRWEFSVHAEIDSIIKARRDVKNTSIVVVRINTLKQFRLSKPCEKCLAYLEYVGIRNIFYSIDAYPYIEYMKI